MWIKLVNRYGGTHHGYFMPRTTPEGLGVSFPELAYDSPSDVAVALFTFPSEAAFRAYREDVKTDPECGAAEALMRDTGCFLKYERLFLERIER
ncbi:hypothetical protein ACPOL_2881 [Acidisarcina polymorpha]|uniref:NIPSNAP domain-containing protein n=2 Tax=Acidisarcina polymorpha TaxID=2211140 RepID=A0A2Z5G0P3_9BACT|nr:hypothetical protein ACPOL_2881 [Acidisarcina polymorpha]